MKKKLLLIFAILLIAAPVFGQAQIPITRRNVSSSRSLDVLLRNRIGILDTQVADLQSSQNVGTGDTYYVDSAVGADTYVGTSPTLAMATLDGAVGLCTDNNGDRIYMMQGHYEDWSAADSADLDVAGITIIGLGEGTDRPRFDYDSVDAEIVFGAANIRLVNVTMRPSIDQVVHAIEIEADADGWIIENCEFLDGEASATDEFIDAIQPAAAADDGIVRYNKATSLIAGASTWLDMTAGVIDNTAVYGNQVYGDFAEAPIYSDDADTLNLILCNVLTNTNAGDLCIEFTAAATGWCIENYVATDSAATDIDAGSMTLAGNVWDDYGDADDLDGIARADRARVAFLESMMGNCPYFTPTSTSTIRYVDERNSNAGTTSSHGHSWEQPYSTIQAAITANNDAIDWAPGQGEWWSENNFIMIAPSLYTENLDAFPWACTMIGLGSNRGYPSSGGSVWVNPASGDAITGSMLSTTVYNIGFQGNSSAGTCMDVTTMNNSAIIGCKIDSNVNDFTCLLQIDESGGATIKDNVFTCGTTPPAYGIHLDGTAFYGGYIENNIINATTAGILVDSTIILSGTSWIKGNYIANPTKGIDINTTSNNLFRVVDNTIIASSAAIEGETAALSLGNWINEAGAADWDPDEAD